MRGLRRKKKGQLNNRGMSIVEVVIAIVILSVAAIPILRSFVSSANYSRQAREKQRVLTAAQSIMEGCKAYNMEELCMQFNGYSPFRLYNNDASDEIAKVSELGTPSVVMGGGTPQFQAKADGSYTFAIKGMQVDGQAYDVKIAVNPYPGDLGHRIGDMENMNPYLDAVYCQADDLDYTKYNEILEKVVNDLNSVDSSMYEPVSIGGLDESRLSVFRTTTVDLQEADGVYTGKVRVRYEYQVSGYPLEKRDGSGSEPFNFDAVLTPVAEDTVEIYNSVATKAHGAELENLYFFYYPAYNGDVPFQGNKAGTMQNEEIIINNNTGKTINMYLVKQKLPGADISDIRLNNWELTYQPTITGSGSPIRLFHNVNEFVTENPSGVHPPASIVGDVITVPLEGETDFSSLFLLDKEKTLLYQVTVSVYEDGAYADFSGEALLDLEGSMNSR